MIPLCVETTHLCGRSAFTTHTHNSCVSPPYVKCSRRRLTAHILPVFNLMFKCHELFGFFFSFFLFLSEPTAARCLTTPWSALRPFLFPESSVFCLKKQHTVMNYFFFFHFFMSMPGTPFSFLQYTNGLNKNSSNLRIHEKSEFLSASHFRGSGQWLAGWGGKTLYANVCCCCFFTVVHLPPPSVCSPSLHVDI